MERERSGTAEVEIDRSELTTVPAGRMRRGVVERLRDAAVPLSLSDLAVALARADVDGGGDVWTRAECYWIELFHTHVPVLEDAGVVEYDHDRRTVSLCPSATDGPIDEETFAAIDTDSEQRPTAE